MRDELRRTLRGATVRRDGAELVRALDGVDVDDYLQLAVGRSTVYELIGNGHLETVHIGRSVRVTIASLEAFVERKRTRVD